MAISRTKKNFKKPMARVAPASKASRPAKSVKMEKAAAKSSAAAKAVEAVKSAKKAIAQAFKPSVAPSSNKKNTKAAPASKTAAPKAVAQIRAKQKSAESKAPKGAKPASAAGKTAKTPAIVEKAAAAQIASIAPVKGKKGMVLAAQPVAPVVPAAGKTLKNARASAKKATEAKKYSGAILLKFEDGSCREMTCESVATTGQYCRMHYIKNWKLIKQREQILKEGKLDRFIAELVAKYPEKYIEAIRFDLAHDQEFAKVIADLEIEEAVDATEDFGEDEDAAAEHLIDHIRRDFTEAEGESF